MRYALLGMALAAACFAGVESRVTRSVLMEVEARINDGFRTIAADPYDLLGTARGIYIDGYGAIFTVEVNLVYITAPNPFRPPLSKEEIENVRTRKLKKLEVLKDQVRQYLLDASVNLNSVPANEKIAMEVFLWNFNWENSAGLPHRIRLSADRQKLKDAKLAKAGKDELKFIEERDL